MKRALNNVISKGKTNTEADRLLKTAALSLLVAAFSAVRIYADISPLSLSALLAFDGLGNPCMLAAYALGSMLFSVGPGDFICRAASAVFLVISEKTLEKHLPRAALLGLSSLSGAAISFIVRPFTRLNIIYSAFGALMSAVFYILLSEAYKVLSVRGKTKKLTKAELSALFFGCLVATLIFSELEVGPFSISAVLIIYLAMLAALKNDAPSAAVYNMAAGLFLLALSPGGAEALCCLAGAAYIGSKLRRFGRAAVPVSYFLMLLPVFFFGVQKSPFTVFDIAAAAALYILTYRRINIDIDKAGSAASEGDREYSALTDRLSELSDAFCFLAESMEGSTEKKQDLRKRAALMAKQAVCRDCFFRSACAFKPERALSFKPGEEASPHFGEAVKKGCRRGEILTAEYSKSYQLCRMEAMWQNRLSEEAEAVSEQMRCVSEIFSDLSGKRCDYFKRDEEMEKRLAAAFSKKGVRIGGLASGYGKKGVLEIRLSTASCNGAGLCDATIKRIAEEAAGTRLERIGVKNCGRCTYGYAALSPYGIDAVKLSLPLEHKSGDAAAFARIDLEHYAIALSDGMGTGAAAAEGSSIAAHTAIKLLASGLELLTTAKMVNTLLINRGGGKSFATLDLAVINVFTGEVEYLKNGAATGYIFTSGGRVKLLCSPGSPLGAVGDCEMNVKKTHISDGDTLIMLTDGVSDAFGGDERKISRMLSEYTAGSTEQLASFIAKNAFAAYGKKIRDDMTVIAAGCIKRRRGGNNMGKKEA